MSKLLSNALLVLFFAALFLSTADAQDDQPKMTDFDRLRGKVVDTSGKPIKEFKVIINIYDYNEGGFGVTPKVVKKWDGEFEDGKFEFEIDEQFEVNEKIYISRQVSAAGYLKPGYSGDFVQLGSFKGRFERVTLARGVRIKGKIVLPDEIADERPVAPQLRVTKKMKSLMPDYQNAFQSATKVEKDGSFEVVVPENSSLELIATAKNAATTRKYIKVGNSDSIDDVQDVGEIQLKEGVKLSGRVVNKDGEPVEGQVIEIKETSKKQNYLPNHITGYAISDENGKFELPPREGKCVVSLVKQTRIEGKLVKANGGLMMAKSQTVELKSGKRADDIEIRESHTWVVHGFISCEGDTKPQVYVQSGDRQQQEVIIDEGGRFEFDVIDESAPYIVIYQGVGKQLYMAKMTTESLKRFRKHFKGSPESTNQFFQFKKVTSDIGPLEFEMVKHEVKEKTAGSLLFDWILGRD